MGVVPLHVPAPGLPRPILRADELRSLLLAPSGPLARVEIVDVTSSTNSDVVSDLRLDPASWPDASVLIAEHQAGGRGRAGRSWETPAGAALTCSFVVRPTIPASTLGWLGLLAGLAAVNALRATAGVPAMLKWPNDLLVPEDTEVEGCGQVSTIGGILDEVEQMTDARTPAVVVGIGINVSQ